VNNMTGKIALTTLALAVLVGLFVLRRSPTAARQTGETASRGAAAGSAGQIDAVARLQQKIDSGAATLTCQAFSDPPASGSR